MAATVVRDGKDYTPSEPPGGTQGVRRRSIRLVAVAAIVVVLGGTAAAIAVALDRSRATEFTDIGVLNRALATSNRFGTLTIAELVVDDDGSRAVHVTINVDESGVDLSNPETYVLPDALRAATHEVWSTLPGKFDRLIVHVISQSGPGGSIRPTTTTYAALLDALGPRPEGLESRDSLATGPDATDEAPGRCAWLPGRGTTRLALCNEPSRLMTQDRLDPVLRETCPAAFSSSPRPRLAGVTMTKGDPDGDTESVSMIYGHASPPTSLSVMHSLDGRRAFVSVLCTTPGQEAVTRLTRDQFLSGEVPSPEAANPGYPSEAESGTVESGDTSSAATTPEPEPVEDYDNPLDHQAGNDRITRKLPEPPAFWFEAMAIEKHTKACVAAMIDAVPRLLTGQAGAVESDYASAPNLLWHIESLAVSFWADAPNGSEARVRDWLASTDRFGHPRSTVTSQCLAYDGVAVG
jgi:hypothetical protein